MKVAANLMLMFADAGGLLSRYDAAAKAGFKLVETPSPYEESATAVAEVLKKNNLSQVLINAPMGKRFVVVLLILCMRTHLTGSLDSFGGRGMACIPHAKQQFRASIEQAIQYAEALDCQKWT